MIEARDEKKLDTLEKIAAGASCAVIVAFLGFWSFQIYETLDLLSMAYGWW